MDDCTTVWSYGDQNQIFSHRWVTLFSYQWCSVRAKLRYYIDLAKPKGVFLLENPKTDFLGFNFVCGS